MNKKYLITERELKAMMGNSVTAKMIVRRTARERKTDITVGIYTVYSFIMFLIGMGVSNNVIHAGEPYVYIGLVVAEAMVFAGVSIFVAKLLIYLKAEYNRIMRIHIKKK